MNDEDAIYAAARRILQSGFATDDSVFTPGRRVWTADAADVLYARFVEHPEFGRGNFLNKLRGQLIGATPPAIQLMAELIYLHLLLPRDIGGGAKRTVVRGALGLIGEPVDIPVELDLLLDSGVVRAGAAYMTQRDRQISWLVRLVQVWKRLPPDRQHAALSDPWIFRQVVDSIPIKSAFSQRNVLLNLVFPSTFPAIASRRHKARIVEAFASDLPEKTGDVDKDLFALGRVLEAKEGTAVHFYHPPWVDQWRTQKSGAVAEGAQRGWLVRGARVHGHNLIDQWLTEGFCSLAFPEVPELKPGLSKVELDQKLQEALPELSPSQRGVRVGVLDRFLNRMREGDVIVTVDKKGLYVGTVAGPVAWSPSADRLSNRRRAVEWANPDTAIGRDELSSGARNKLSGQLTVTDLGSHVTEFAALAELEVSAVEELDAEDQSMVAEAELPEPTNDLAERLLIDLGWLAETVDLLREKKQIVLYGPPGTGKTYLAQELAQFVTGGTESACRLVQFHPSYSYEDFFEGFRPRSTADGSGIGFALEPGPLKQLVAEAKEDASQAFVLIIDEINRANLAKVFGELYFLLEYRDRSIQLQYSPTEDFGLPPNIYLIGTMNTADRSIALVDAAMRRRFYFQSLFPSEPPLQDMFRRWLKVQKLPEDHADLLDELNRAIGDRDAAVGPSYLMTKKVGTEEGLARIWKTAIVPLLEERHVGDGVDVQARYGIEALRKRLQQNGSTSPLPAAVVETGDEPQ